MSLLFATGSPACELTPVDLKQALYQALDSLGERHNVIVVHLTSPGTIHAPACSHAWRTIITATSWLVSFRLPEPTRQ